MKMLQGPGIFKGAVHLSKNFCHQYMKARTLHNPPQEVITKMSGTLAASVQEKASCVTLYNATSSIIHIHRIFKKTHLGSLLSLNLSSYGWKTFIRAALWKLNNKLEVLQEKGTMWN